MKQIKRDEDKKNKIAKEQEALDRTNMGTNFDTWWVDTSKRLNLAPHMKEIVWADFKARGLKKTATNKQYNDALAMFGYK